MDAREVYETRIKPRLVDDPERPGCRVWPGSNSAGYGTLHWNRKTAYTHRITCEAVHGPPLGRDALHSCDNPPCNAEDHLSWGTSVENAEAMISRGRHRNGPRRRGEANNKAKITAQQAAEIYTATGTLKEIAARYPLGETGCHAIRTGRTWRHVTQTLTSGRS